MEKFQQSPISPFYVPPVLPPTLNFRSIEEPLPEPPQDLKWDKDIEGNWVLLNSSGEMYDSSSSVSKSKSNIRDYTSTPELQRKILYGESVNTSDTVEAATTAGEVNECNDINEVHVATNVSDEVEVVVVQTEVTTPVEVEISEVKKDIEHIVSSTDTLNGLCLRYSVTATEIRRTNMFSGSNIQGFRKLRIPLNELNKNVYVPQETKEQQALHQFKMETKEDVVEAKLYLEEANYDVALALQAWREDNQFSKDMITTEVSNDRVIKAFNGAMHCKKKLDVDVLYQFRWLWVNANEIHYSKTKDKLSYKIINIQKDIINVERIGDAVRIHFNSLQLPADISKSVMFMKKTPTYMDIEFHSNDYAINKELTTALYKLIKNSLQIL